MTKKVRGKILFLDSIHPKLQDLLVNSGFECYFDPKITPTTLIEQINSYDGIIVRSKMGLDKKILSHANNIRFIGRVGSGMENVDVEYAESIGIRCLNSPEGNRDAVGEHALGMLLSLMNNMCRASAQVQDGQWNREENRGHEISGKTVGIIGYGNMGSAFAQRLKGFDARVIAYDKYKKNFSNNLVKEVRMDEIFEESDILSLHLPLTAETRYLVDETYLKFFKKPIWLINTSRGPVVKTSALVWALQNKIITGAALDVLEYENSSFSDIDKNLIDDSFNTLTGLNNVILSPHVAGWTHESNIKLAEVLAEKINRLYS